MEVMSNCRKKGEKEEVLGEDDQILLKKRISSHPSYGQLVEAHLSCLKVGAMVKFDRNHIRDHQKQQENDPSSHGMASTTRSELDHFMEAYCLALRKLKEAMEEPQQTSMAFINDMHSQLQELTSCTYPVPTHETTAVTSTTTSSSVHDQ